MSDHPSKPPEPDEQVIPPCPICNGPLAQVYAKFNQIVLVCGHCQTNITVPGSAWHVRKLKKLNIWRENPGA
jgi:hypothetical protein